MVKNTFERVAHFFSHATTLTVLVSYELFHFVIFKPSSSQQAQVCSNFLNFAFLQVQKKRRTVESYLPRQTFVSDGDCHLLDRVCDSSQRCNSFENGSSPITLVSILAPRCGRIIYSNWSHDCFPRCNFMYGFCQTLT